MTAEPPSNSFRASVLARAAGKPHDIVKRTKTGQLGVSGEGLELVQIPRAECRRTNQRGGDRHRLTAEQAILRHGDREDVVEIVNLSAGGVMIHTDLNLALWEHVGLVLGGDDVIDCVVRWLKGDQIGLEFTEETRIDCDQETRDSLLRDVIRKSFPDLTGDPLYYPQRRADDDPAVDDEEAQRRSAERHSLIWSGIVYHGGHSDPVRIRNISSSGALVQSGDDLPIDDSVVLDLGAAGIVEATVRWTRGGQSGLSFGEAFDLKRLATARPEIAEIARSLAG